MMALDAGLPGLRDGSQRKLEPLSKLRQPSGGSGSLRVLLARLVEIAMFSIIQGMAI